MTPLPSPAPTLAAARAALGAVRPSDYARTRNHLDGAVTGLSPWLTHGIITLAEAMGAIASAHRLRPDHKLVYEFGWRAYFRHVWQHQGVRIARSLHEGPLPDSRYLRTLPADVREARTGVPAIDAAVRTLYATGLLHNHARMWLASYVVHLRRVHWRAGADWMLGHLLDGDLASNHLSWQWVAGTGSHKPYLFNAENVARHAPRDWHSAGSAIDRSYEALDDIARGGDLPPLSGHRHGVEEPALREPAVTPAFDATLLQGRDVWIAHPWALRAPPPHPEGGNWLVLGLLPAAAWRGQPWSERRWRWVAEGLAALTPHSACLLPGPLAEVLRGARRVHTWAEPHADAHWPATVQRHAEVALFPAVSRPCGSFSQWWTRAMKDVRTLDELPGLRAVAADPSTAGPLFA